MPYIFSELAYAVYAVIEAIEATRLPAITPGAGKRSSQGGGKPRTSRDPPLATTSSS